MRGSQAGACGRSVPRVSACRAGSGGGTPSWLSALARAAPAPREPRAVRPCLRVVLRPSSPLTPQRQQPSTAPGTRPHRLHDPRAATTTPPPHEHHSPICKQSPCIPLAEYLRTCSAPDIRSPRPQSPAWSLYMQPASKPLAKPWQPPPRRPPGPTSADEQHYADDDTHGEHGTTRQQPATAPRTRQNPAPASQYQNHPETPRDARTAPKHTKPAPTRR